MTPSISASEGSENNPGASLRSEPIDVSWFDRMVALLLATICFMGLLTSLLLILWAWPQSSPTTPRLFLPEPDSASSVAPGGRPAEFDALLEDELDSFLDETPMTKLETLADAVMLVALSMEEVPDASLSRSVSGTGGDDQSVPSDATADELDSNTIPRYNRWKLVLTAKNIGEYAIQLDHLQMELGVYGGPRSEVLYGSRFSSRPLMRIGQSTAEKRVYFRWLDSHQFAKFDQQLLEQAGISTAGCQVAMFLTPELEADLARLEMEWGRAKGVTEVTQIAQTIFEVRPENGRFALRVMDQRKRVAR